MDIELDQRKGGLTLWHVFHGALGLVGHFLKSISKSKLNSNAVSGKKVRSTRCMELWGWWVVFSGVIPAALGLT